jgi:hypothetical protein
MVGQTLSSSAEKIGCLYPILLDNNGEIIDGEHRFQANKNWRKVRLAHIKTEKDRLLVRIVANNVRRSVPSTEKNRVLNELGQILMDEGIEPGQIASVIAEKTGMSYRWVAKYLASDYKDKAQIRKAMSAAQHATKMFNEVTTAPKRKEQILIKNYTNAGFVMITVPKDFYTEFQEKSLSIGIPVETSILKALEQHLDKMKQMPQLKTQMILAH